MVALAWNLKEPFLELLPGTAEMVGDLFENGGSRSYSELAVPWDRNVVFAVQMGRQPHVATCLPSPAVAKRFESFDQLDTG